MVVGFDRGVANSVAPSDGRMFHAPGLTAGEQVRFLVLQRRLADRRGDWIEQTATNLTGAYTGAAIENLPIRTMTRRAMPKPDPDHAGTFLPNGGRAKSGLNRAILASC